MVHCKWFSVSCTKSESNEDFIKSYNEESHEGYFLEVDVQYSEKLHDFHNEKLKNLQPKCMIKKIRYLHK